MKRYIAETCSVTCEDNDRVLVADILDFREGQRLSVSLEKSLKLELRWNGQIYEGRIGGRSFVSKGPKITEVQQGR